MKNKTLLEIKDLHVSVGEKVRCCFLPTDAVLVDQGGTNA